MDRYLLDIKADDKPVLLERVLRVIRHRGFVIKQVAATQNHESKVASVEIIVDSAVTEAGNFTMTIECF